MALLHDMGNSAACTLFTWSGVSLGERSTFLTEVTPPTVTRAIALVTQALAKI